MSLPLRISATYGLICALYIVFSDTVVYFLLGDQPSLLTLVSVSKGFLFVVVTTITLFFFLKREAQKLEDRDVRLSAQDVALKQQLMYQANLLQTVSDAIIAVDPNGIITSWNNAAGSLYGWTAEEVIGKPLETFMRTEYIHTNAEAVYADFLKHSHWEGEVIQHRKDGSTIAIYNSAVMLKDANDNYIGVVGINRDMTWQRKLAAEIQERQRLQDDLDRELEMRTMRAKFVSMVSHEFRNPLAAIQSATDILLHYHDRLTDEKRAQYLAQAQEQVAQINELLNDFLAFSRMETIGVQFDGTPVNVPELIREVVASVRQSWGHRSFELELTENCPLITLDRKLIIQALRNLLSNAVKYSPDDSKVTVRLTCTQDGAQIEVEDHGIGIPEEEQSRLSEPFFRASNVGTTEGSGLGLAIVWRAIEAHSGRVIVSSKPAAGTVIKIVLPHFNGKTAGPSPRL